LDKDSQISFGVLLNLSRQYHSSLKILITKDKVLFVMQVI